MDEKKTGSFYTPNALINYMVDSVHQRFNIRNVLEPSAGDGRFIDLLDTWGCPIHAVEIDSEKVNALSKKGYCNVRPICNDFVEYSLTNNNEYDLIIGNPPYISKKNLNEEARDLSLKLIDTYELPHPLFQNLWVSFILGSLKLLSENGIIFFVLPFEFLQVQYAEGLREFLEGRFNTIEITTFEEKVFENIEQDVCLVLLCNEDVPKPFIKYTTIKSIIEPEVTFQSVIMRNKPLKKWSNCILNDTETESLKELSIQYPKIKEFGDISPGIVTGANSFFIIDCDKANELNMLESYIHIISKSSDLSNVLIFSENDYQNLLANDKKVLMLNLNSINEDQFTLQLQDYLTAGENKELNKRYKCSIRRRWYDVPIINRGNVSFFKRFSSIPRLVINEAQVYTTDIAYNIRFSPNVDYRSFAFCFYNSLTLVLCEYNGRFYGGGVGELVPNEFKNLHIPYRHIPNENILELDNMFRRQCIFSDIVDYVDNVVLKIPADKKRMLQDIRNRYLDRRLKR